MSLYRISGERAIVEIGDTTNSKAPIKAYVTPFLYLMQHNAPARNEYAP